MAILTRRMLTVTHAPNLSGFMRIVPALARAGLLPARPVRSKAQMST